MFIAFTVVQEDPSHSSVASLTPGLNHPPNIIPDVLLAPALPAKERVVFILGLAVQVDPSYDSEELV